MTTSLTGIRSESSGLRDEVTPVNVATERTATRLDAVAEQVDQLTPPAMDTRRIRKQSNGTTVRVTTVSGAAYTFDANDAESVVFNTDGDPACHGERVIRMEYSSGVVIDFSEEPPRITVREAKR
jgi:hypothetical protein